MFVLRNEAGDYLTGVAVVGQAMLLSFSDVPAEAHRFPDRGQVDLVREAFDCLADFSPVEQA